MKIKDLNLMFEILKSNHITFDGKCHDCRASVSVNIDRDPDGKVTVDGGAIYWVQTGPSPDDKDFFLKCDKCFKKNPELRNYMPCEVYSRVVGYLRPVNQWNEGKRQEFKARKKFQQTLKEKDTE